MALDMTTLQWTRILDTGFTVGVSDHTISRVSDTEILLIGGNMGSVVSDKKMLFKFSKRIPKTSMSLKMKILLKKA